MTSREVIDLCNILLQELKLDRSRQVVHGNESLVQVANGPELKKALGTASALKPVAPQAKQALRLLEDHLDVDILLPAKIAVQIDAHMAKVKGSLGVMVSTHLQVVGADDPHNISLRFPESVDTPAAAGKLFHDLDLYLCSISLRYTSETLSLQSVAAGSKWAVLRAAGSSAYKAVVWIFSRIYESREARAKYEKIHADLQAIVASDTLIAQTQKNMLIIQEHYMTLLEEDLLALSAPAKDTAGENPATKDPATKNPVTGDANTEKRTLLREAFTRLEAYIDAGLKVRLSVSAPANVNAHLNVLPDTQRAALGTSDEPKALGPGADKE